MYPVWFKYQTLGEINWDKLFTIQNALEGKTAQMNAYCKISLIMVWYEKKTQVGMIIVHALSI